MLMLKNFIGIAGTYCFLFGSIYLTLRYSVFKIFLAGKVICHKFLLNEVICALLSLLIVFFFFTVSTVN